MQPEVNVKLQTDCKPVKKTSKYRYRLDPPFLDCRFYIHLVARFFKSGKLLDMMKITPQLVGV